MVGHYHNKQAHTLSTWEESLDGGVHISDGDAGGFVVTIASLTIASLMKL